MTRGPRLALAVALLAGAAPARADSLLAPAAAPARSAAPPAADPSLSSLPTGREVIGPQRPPPSAAPVVACSFTEPVCVHAAASVAPAAILATLDHAEVAQRAYRALGLPPPLPPLTGRAAHDLYLLPSAGHPFTAADIAPRPGGWDRATSFSVLPPPSPGAGCAAAFTVAHALAHGIALRLDAGAEPGALSMTASYLASLAAPCAAVEIAAVDDFQRAPQRSFIAGDPDRPDGALLFPWFLDDALGRGNPGAVMTSLLAMAVQRTPPGSWTFHNEPDTFDVLRATLRDRGTTLDQVLLDFAVARAFVGSRSDGAHLGDVERFGDMGRVRFEWSVPYSSLPRRLAPGFAVESTGMTYLWVDTSDAPPGSELTFVADWELPAVFRWALVKVGKDGAERGRLDVAGLFGASHAERTVVGIDGLAGVLIAGVNAGSMDRSHPFDPDEQPATPHAYTATLVK